jgi:RHS repeat-associated protein
VDAAISHHLEEIQVIMINPRLRTVNLSKRYHHVSSVLVIFLFVTSLLAISGRSFAQPPITNSGGSSTGPGGNGAASPGLPSRWLGSIAGAMINTGTGNKLTAIPLFGWKARGGMGVGFTLYHNSFGDLDQTINPKWRYSYDSYITVDPINDNAVMHWEDGTTFTCVVSGSTYTPPTGNFDTIYRTQAFPGSFHYYTKDQIDHYFEKDTTTSGTLDYYYLKTITDRNGNQITVNRTGYPKVITSIEDPTGRAITISYSSNSRTITDPSGNVWTLGFTQSSNGLRMTSITFPDPDGGTNYPVINLGYNTQGNITSYQDKRGNFSYFGYGSGSSVNAIALLTDACNNTTALGYGQTSPGSGMAVITDPNGHQSYHIYDNGKLTHVKVSVNQFHNSFFVTSYSYDSNFNVSGVTDSRSNLWGFSYDSKGNVLTATDPDNHTSTMTYTPKNDIATVTDPLNHTTTFGYDTPGNVTFILDANNTTSSVIPNIHGLPTSASNGLAHTTTFGYDTHGNVNYVRSPNGVEGWATYDLMGRVISTQDAYGNLTTYVRDRWGRVKSITHNGGLQIPLYRMKTPNGDDHLLTAYFPEVISTVAGGLTQMGVIGYVYTSSSASPGLVAFHRLVKAGSGHFLTTDPSEVQSLQGLGYTYEGIAGYVHPGPGTGRLPLYRMAKLTSGVRVYTANEDEYNSADPALWQKEGIACYVMATQGSGIYTTNFTYDANSNLLTATGPNNVSVTSTYDACNRLLTSTNGRGDTTTYHYDDPGKKGLLCWKKNGNQAQTTYTYDYLYRLSQVTHPDNSTEQYSYDQNGNVLTYTNGGNFTNSYVYDKENRLTTINHPGTGSPVATAPISYGYDDAGRMTTMTDAGGTTTWSYDPGNRLTQIASPQGTVTYEYDTVNRPWRRTVQNLGSWTYGYAAGSRVTSVTTPFNETTTFAYDAAGRVKQQNNPNGTVAGYGYDGAGRIVNITHFHATTKLPMRWFQYAYDGAGRITEQFMDTDANRTRYEYDNASQLTREWHTDISGTNTWYDIGYSYDGNGNRLTKTYNGSTDTYTYDAADKLLSVSGAWGIKTFGYTGAGEVTVMLLNGQTTASLEWDYEGRMIHLWPHNNGVPDFPNTILSRYNGLGLRVSKQDGTGTYNNIHGGASPGSPLLSDGAAVYTAGLSERRGGQSKYYQSDLQGSLNNLTAANGDATDSSWFDSFGLRYGHVGTTPTPFGYAASSGYQKDATGLILAGHRFYDPSIGRFLSRDPAGHGTNWYAYCDNNPVTQTDPLGLKPLGLFPTVGDPSLGTLGLGTAFVKQQWSSLVIKFIGPAAGLAGKFRGWVEDFYGANSPPGTQQALMMAHQQGWSQMNRNLAVQLSAPSRLAAAAANGGGGGLTSFNPGNLQWFHYSTSANVQRTGLGLGGGNFNGNTFLTDFDAQGTGVNRINNVLSSMSPQNGPLYQYQYSVNWTGLTNNGVQPTHVGVWEVEITQFIDPSRIGPPIRIPGR